MKVNKRGIHITSIDVDTKREDMPKEIREAHEMIDTILHNTVTLCKKKDLNLTLLPSIYLHAFNKMLPLVVESIDKQNAAEARMFLNSLRTIIEDSFELEKVREMYVE